MTIIGIEEHWTTPRLTAALEGLPEERRDDSLAFNEMGDNLARLEDIGEARIAAMDEQGIDMQIFSVAPPATGPLAPADAVSLEPGDERSCRGGGASSSVPTAGDVHAADGRSEAVAGELERAAGLGCVGAMVYGRTGETPLDDPCYEDLFAAAAALGQPIFIHPQIPARTIRQAAYAGFDPMTDLALSTFGWGWHLEAARRRSPAHRPRHLRPPPRPQDRPRSLGRAAAVLGRTG